MTTEIVLSFLYFTSSRKIKISFTLHACLVVRLQFYKRLKQNSVLSQLGLLLCHAPIKKRVELSIKKFLLEDVIMNLIRRHKSQFRVRPTPS